MAASVATVLDAATIKRPADGATEPLGNSTTTTGTTMSTMNVVAEAQPEVATASEDDKQFISEETETTTVDSVAGPGETEATTTVVLAVDILTPSITAPKPPTSIKKATPISARSKSANALGIVTPKKKSKKKLHAKPSHPSVGMSVDALDRNMVWGNGRILDVNVEEQRLKITFPGFNKNWDIWTDMLSIAPHCTQSNRARLNARSWDGSTDLFTGERVVSDDVDGCASPKWIKRSPHDDVVLAPSKPPVRKPKKGYVLELIPDNEISSTPPKARSNSSVLKRQAMESNEKSSEPKKPRTVKRETRPPTPPPKADEPYTNEELNRQRTENASTMDKTAAFLQQCAALWKRQLGAMTEDERQALFAHQRDSEEQMNSVVL